MIQGSYRGDEAGGGGGDGGPGRGGGVMERLGERAPHDGVAAEQQACTQQPEGRGKLTKRHLVEWTHLHVHLGRTNVRLLL